MGPLKEFVDDGGFCLGKHAETFLIDNFDDLRLLRGEAVRLGVTLPGTIVVEFDQTHSEQCELLLPGSESFPAAIANSILDCLDDDTRFEV